MTAKSWRESVSDLLPAFLAGLTLLLATLANFLDHNDYPLMRPEVALITAAAALVSALMAPFHHAQRQWGRSFLEGFLAALFIDFNSSSLPLSIGVGLAVAAFTWWRRTTLLSPMALIGGVILLTTILGIRGETSWVRTVATAQAAQPRATDRPPILHLILDEHIGLKGLERMEPDGKNLSDQLRQSYIAAGFAVYGGAYSEHMRTVNAIPHILNFGQGRALETSKLGVRIGRTEYLRSLVEEGYRVKIWQTDFADFCTDNLPVECTTYDSSSPRPTLPLPLSVTQRTAIILSKIVQLSDIAGVAEDTWNLAAFRLIQGGIERVGRQFEGCRPVHHGGVT